MTPPQRKVEKENEIYRTLQKMKSFLLPAEQFVEAEEVKGVTGKALSTACFPLKLRLQSPCIVCSRWGPNSSQPIRTCAWSICGECHTRGPRGVGVPREGREQLSEDRKQCTVLTGTSKGQRGFGFWFFLLDRINQDQSCSEW